MTGILTGLLVIALGGFAFLFAYVSSRMTDIPFMNKNLIGGYNGVLGLVAIVVGVVIVLVSTVGLLFFR